MSDVQLSELLNELKGILILIHRIIHSLNHKITQY